MCVCVALSASEPLWRTGLVRAVSSSEGTAGMGREGDGAGVSSVGWSHARVEVEDEGRCVAMQGPTLPVKTLCFALDI